MIERQPAESRPPDENKVDGFIEILRHKSPDELQQLDLRLTKRGGKFALFAAILRGEFGDLEDEGTEKKIDAAIARYRDEHDEF